LINDDSDEAKQLKIELTKGINQYVFSFHGDLSKKVLINTTIVLHQNFVKQMKSQLLTEHMA
jgi:hypothetical protein